MNEYDIIYNYNYILVDVTKHKPLSFYEDILQLSIDFGYTVDDELYELDDFIEAVEGIAPPYYILYDANTCKVLWDSRKKR